MFFRWQKKLGIRYGLKRAGGEAAGIIMTIAGIFVGYVAYIAKLLLDEGFFVGMEAILLMVNLIIRDPAVLKELIGNVAIALLISGVYIVLTLHKRMKEWRFPEIVKAGEITE
jgi:hypothetical protein